MNQNTTLVAEPRATRGKNEAYRLRLAGLSPAVLYGGAEGPVAVSVNPKVVNKILHSKSGHNTIIQLTVGADTTPAMIVDWQRDPIKGQLLHVDLQRIDLSHRLNVKVPVHTMGDPKGVKTQGGLHEIVNREIEIECLPTEIPESFVVDVSELLIGQGVRASDIPLSGSMLLVTPADTVLSHVIALRASATVTTEEAAPAAVESSAADKKAPEKKAPEKKSSEKKAPEKK